MVSLGRSRISGEARIKTASEKLREYRHRMRIESPEQYHLYKQRDTMRKRKKRAQVKGLKNFNWIRIQLWIEGFMVELLYKDLCLKLLQNFCDQVTLHKMYMGKSAFTYCKTDGHFVKDF